MLFSSCLTRSIIELPLIFFTLPFKLAAVPCSSRSIARPHRDASGNKKSARSCWPGRDSSAASPGRGRGLADRGQGSLELVTDTCACATPPATRLTGNDVIINDRLSISWCCRLTRQRRPNVRACAQLCAVRLVWCAVVSCGGVQLCSCAVVEWEVGGGR
jgi:hypothetical protein